MSVCVEEDEGEAASSCLAKDLTPVSSKETETSETK